MHTDRKIGFAMGILLIGIVAALFFRNEPLLSTTVPGARREQELNERLRERDVAVYLNDNAADEPPEEAQNDQPWTLRDVLQKMNRRNKTAPVPVGAGSIGVFPEQEVPIPSVGDSGALPPLLPVEPSHPGVVKLPSLPLSTQGGSNDGLRADTPASDFQPPEVFEEYVVRYGDTLSAIAQRMLGSQKRFIDIYKANQDRMASPDRLEVGKTLRIPRVAENNSPTY